MKQSSFNRDWIFFKQGEESSARAVTLPHDAMLYETRDRNAVTGAACGWLPMSGTGQFL